MAAAKPPGLARLADRLVLRHLRVSVPDYGARQELQNGRTLEPLLEQDLRCIAIVGAGASEPLLARGADLATELERQFRKHDDAREAELFRLERVYGLNPAHFETRLAALSAIPEVTHLVRNGIADRYSVRHPTILGYELLAHLLKHRFIDAVISFNFDELLDQSLDDELGLGEYRRLVSDRDCTGVEVDPDSSDYLPLYLKLHGTSTEPDSLRFTREAYYRLPDDLSAVVQSLFESQHCVILNVGYGMDGFDLHRLLRIPQQLEVYDLSYLPLTERVRQAICAERRKSHPDSFHSKEHRGEPDFVLLSARQRARKLTCDAWLKRLVNEIDCRSGANALESSVANLVKFRTVVRHEAISNILGPDARLARWTREPAKYRRDYETYLKQRTVLELAFSGAKARGLAQLSWLAIDRCGMYYELYRREAKDHSQSWSELRSAAGLDENEWLPDVVESAPRLCAPSAPPTVSGGKWMLREFNTEALAAHVLAQLGIDSKGAKTALATALADLQAGSEVEIQTTDDKVCRKAFNSPLPLPTTTALSVFTGRLFKDLKPEDHVYISCETGEWLLENGPIKDLLARQEHVEVITAFDLKLDDLDGEYGGRLKCKYIEPWRHNRHMTIVCRGQSPWKAVYFARRLRTPLITPIFLKEPEDAARLMRAYELMRYQSDEREGAEEGAA